MSTKECYNFVWHEMHDRGCEVSGESFFIWHICPWASGGILNGLCRWWSAPPEQKQNNERFSEHFYLSLCNWGGSHCHFKQVDLNYSFLPFYHNCMQLQYIYMHCNSKGMQFCSLLRLLDSDCLHHQYYLSIYMFWNLILSPVGRRYLILLFSLCTVLEYNISVPPEQERERRE